MSELIDLGTNRLKVKIVDDIFLPFKAERIKALPRSLRKPHKKLIAKMHFWSLYYKGVFILVLVFSKVLFWFLDFQSDFILVLAINSMTNFFNYLNNIKNSMQALKS